jgi:signal transduction histidine kinase
MLLDEASWLAELSQRRQITVDLATLEVQRITAQAIAQSRAAWLASAVIFLIIASLWLMFLRSRRSRRREMESLRHRISRDLHDEIGSHLGSIRLMSELALRDGSASDSLEEIHRLAGEAAESMRGIIWLVREGDSPPLTSLVEAMRQSAGALLKDIDWQIEVTEFKSETASLEFHRQVFLLFREAAHNITRHAHAAQVRIEVQWKAKHFHLRIEDNGSGFDVAAVTAGNGLANLHHRATVLGGTLQITSRPGSGTCITLEADFS